jgi:hypothetical protein
VCVQFLTPGPDQPLGALNFSVKSGVKIGQAKARTICLPIYSSLRHMNNFPFLFTIIVSHLCLKHAKTPFCFEDKSPGFPAWWLLLPIPHDCSLPPVEILHESVVLTLPDTVVLVKPFSNCCLPPSPPN